MYDINHRSEMKNDFVSVREKLIDISCGLLAVTTDVLLFTFFQTFNAGKYGYGSIAVRKSTEDSLKEVESLGIDKDTIQKTIWKATHKNLIKRSTKNNIEITKEGLKRLNEVIPSYHENRKWEGHFYTTPL